jgi:hypothetical protein
MKTHFTHFLAKPGNCAPSGLKIPRTSGGAVCPSGILGGVGSWENTVWPWKLCCFGTFPMARRCSKPALPTRWIRPTTVRQLVVWPWKLLFQLVSYGLAMLSCCTLAADRFWVFPRSVDLWTPSSQAYSSRNAVWDAFGWLDHRGYAGA